MIEAAASPTGNMRHDTVKGLPVSLVGVKAVVQECAKEPSALRDTPGDSPFDGVSGNGEFRGPSIL